MYKDLINNLKYNIKNIPGWRSKRKIVVFECDDWGSNRISSKESYDQLIKMGIPVSDSAYNQYDTIERQEDLENLFNVLTSYQDYKGRSVVFTPFFNMANPDFEKIKEKKFESYEYESVSDTLKRYGIFREVSTLYKQGIDERIFLPQFHGREHVNVSLWMEYLRRKDETVMNAFKQHFYSVPVEDLNSITASFRPEFYYREDSELDFLAKSIEEGISLFQELFGYSPRVFDPPNGIFPSVLEKSLYENGIKTIVANRFRLEPIGKENFRKKYYSFGEKNQYGQTYYIRNCAFEPYDNRAVDYCLRMVEAAFRWGKPAIISTHRVNYNGGICPANREKGLDSLKALLEQMLTRWPKIEFLSSGEFSKIINQSNDD